MESKLKVILIGAALLAAISVYLGIKLETANVNTASAERAAYNVSTAFQVHLTEEYGISICKVYPGESAGTENVRACLAGVAVKARQQVEEAKK